MAENKKQYDIEVVQEGFANGVASDEPLSDTEKQNMINQASVKFGEFLDALKCDWRNDPNSDNTRQSSRSIYTRHG